MQRTTTQFGRLTRVATKEPIPEEELNKFQHGRAAEEWTDGTVRLLV